MTFREFLVWQEQEVKGCKYFPGAKIAPGLEVHKIGFGGARKMRMAKAEGPSIPISHSPGRIQAKPGIANKK